MTEELAGAVTAAPPGTGAPSPEGTPADLGAAESRPTEVTTAEKPAVESEKPAEKPADWWRTDPEAQAAIRAEADRLAQKRIAREVRKQKLGVARDDPVKALEYVQAEHGEIEAEEQATGAQATAQAEAAATLGELWSDTEWRDGYNQFVKANKAEADRRWAEDPAAYIRWADRQVIRSLALEAARKEFAAKTSDLVKAEAEVMTNQRLGAVPVFPTANGGVVSDADFLRAYSQGRSDDHDRARKVLAAQ